MTININGTTGISGVNGSETTPAIQGDNDTNTGISFDTDEVNIVTGGTTAVTVDSSQNVGIGTATAGLKLHVQDGALASAPTPNSNCDVVIEGTTDTGIQFLSSGQTQLRFGDAGSTGAGSIIYSHADDDLSFTVNGNYAGKFDSSGRLLVGTEDEITGSSTNDNLQLVNSAGSILSVATSDTTIASGTRIGEIEFWGKPGGTWGKFGAIGCFGDQTADSGDNPGRLAFYTTPDNTTGALERMRIQRQGQAKIGTHATCDGMALELHSTSNNSNVGTLYVRNNNADASSPVAAFATATNSTANSNVLIKFGINSYSSGSGQIHANGSGQAAFGFFSDERLKENIVDLPSQWENIKNLRPVEFDYIESQGGGHQIGFVAQEFETVYPDAVASQPMFVGFEETSDEERLTLTGWSKTEARLVKALQEAIAKIENLEAQNAEQATTIASFEARISALEGGN